MVSHSPSWKPVAGVEGRGQKAEGILGGRSRGSKGGRGSPSKLKTQLINSPYTYLQLKTQNSLACRRKALLKTFSLQPSAFPTQNSLTDGLPSLTSPTMIRVATPTNKPFSRTPGILLRVFSSSAGLSMPASNLTSMTKFP